jgi:hypothetical protein
MGCIARGEQRQSGKLLPCRQQRELRLEHLDFRFDGGDIGSRLIGLPQREAVLV